MSVKKICFLVIAFFFFEQCVVAQEHKAEKEEIRKNIQAAVTEFEDAKYVKALEYSRLALATAFSINDDSFIAQSFNTIGAIYDECSETKKAIAFYHKALRYAEPVKNDTLNSWIYSNLGSAYYFNQIDVEKGINYYKKALFHAKKVKDSSQVIYTKLNLVSAYLADDRLQDASREISDIEKIVFESDDEHAKLLLLVSLGIRADKVNNKTLAENFFFKALEIAMKNDWPTFEINIYENLVKHYNKFNVPDLMNLYQNKFDKLSDEVYSKDKLEALRKEALQIELDENKILLEKIELQNLANQKKAKDSKLAVILFIIIVIVLLLLLLTLYKNIKSREQLNLELKHANDELKVAKEKAEEASRLKSQFVSTITHELRTPLYGVVGITNIILDEHKELNNSPHIKSLKFSAKYLLSLVNDILQINKIEERKIALENNIFNLADEIQTIYNSVEYIADRNNNKLIVEIDTAIPEFLIGDKLRLSQILMNLVSNALKFTKNGKVIVSADLKQIRETNYDIEFKVKDNGVGIAKEHQEKIFDKFVQIERREEDYQGTGLGLSIVSSLIQLFNSEIHLESEENVGTTFTFTIGFEHDEEKSREIINNIDVDLTSNQSYRILVVEDNKINQMVTKKIIENSNLSCTIVDDGYASIVALEREYFDLVLMDLNMPLINGFDTAKKIREKGIKIPIIALTAFDKQEVIEDVIASGMNDIIIKPFEPARLYQIITNHIQKENAG